MNSESKTLGFYDKGFSCICRRTFLGILLACSALLARGQEVRIVSPDEAQTFAMGSATKKTLLWDEKEQVLEAKVTFSNAAYADSLTPATEESFVFKIPDVSYNSGDKTFYVKSSKGEMIPVAHRIKKLFFTSIEPTRNATFRIVRTHGKAQVTLEAVSPKNMPKEDPKYPDDTHSATLQDLIGR